MEAKGKLGVLLIGFITIILAITLLQSTANSVYDATNVENILNETVTVAANTTQTAQTDNVILTYFGNATISTDTAGIEIGEEVNYTSTGAITVKEANFSAGNWLATYTYHDDDYINNSTSRTLIRLITIFFALGVLFVGIVMFNKLREGVM